LAAFFLRAFFLRDFFAMVVTLIRRVSPAARAPARDWMADLRGAALPVGAPQPPRSATGANRRTVMAEEIRAEMVANVWKVVKAAGDEVSEGDTLVILESMKMEIPVVAESDGTLAEIAVSEGDVVQEGDLIAVIE
jgi:acetyl-CoA carboxylase biotin carboxyl carrier protein